MHASCPGIARGWRPTVNKAPNIFSMTPSALTSIGRAAAFQWCQNLLKLAFGILVAYSQQRISCMLELGGKRRDQIECGTTNRRMMTTNESQAANPTGAQPTKPGIRDVKGLETLDP
eukprot:111574-Amphidinium_carterae.2